MSYAGTYDETPVPEPKRRPRMDVDLDCGHSVSTDPYWSGDPLYGGWKPPAYAWCALDQKSVFVRRRSERKVRTTPGEAGA